MGGRATRVPTSPRIRRRNRHRCPRWCTWQCPSSPRSCRASRSNARTRRDSARPTTKARTAAHTASESGASAAGKSRAAAYLIVRQNTWENHGPPSRYSSPAAGTATGESAVHRGLRQAGLLVVVVMRRLLVLVADELDEVGVDHEPLIHPHRKRLRER